MTPTKQAEPEDATDLLFVQKAALKKQLEDVKRKIKEKAEEAAKPKYQRTQDTEELLAELAAINKKLDYISGLQDQLWESLPKGKEYTDNTAPAIEESTTTKIKEEPSPEEYLNSKKPASDTPEWNPAEFDSPKRSYVKPIIIGFTLFMVVIIVLFYVLKV